MVIVRMIVLGVLVATPWWLGGVLESTQVYLFVAMALAGLGWLIAARDQPVRLPRVLVLLLAAIALGLLQLCPLPQTIARVVSPQAVKLREPLAADAAPRSVEVGNALPVRHTMSLRPAATRYDLSLLVLSTTAFMLGAQLFVSQRSRLQLCSVVAINGAILAFFGLLQKLTWNGQLFWIGPVPSNPNPFASFVNRNNAGGYLNLCLAGAVVLMLWAANRDTQLGGDTYDEAPGGDHLDTLKVASGALAAVIVGGILCTLSRGAGIALLSSAIVTALAVMATGRQRLRTRGGLIVLAAGIGLVGWVGMRDALIERFGTLSEREQLVASGRVPNWRDALQSVPDFWLTGSGLGTYRDVYPLYQQRYDPTWYYYAENQYVQAIVEAGVPGLVLLLLTLGVATTAIWTLIRTARDPLDYAFAVGGLLVVVSQAIHSVFDFGLYVPANMLLMAVMCGAVLSPGGRGASGGRGFRRAENAPWPFTGWRRRAGFGSAEASPSRTGFAFRALFALLCLGLLLAAWQIRAFVQTREAMDRTDFSTLAGGASEQEMREAIAAMQARLPASPDDAELHYELAKAWIYLHRAQGFNRLRQTSPPSVSIEQLWNLASTTELHRQAFQLLRDGDRDGLDKLRNEPQIVQHLVPARRHLQLAERSCPLLAKIHLRLARLSFLGEDPSREMAHADLARRLAPSDPYTLLECGLLDLQAGRVKAACQSWQHALTLSAEYVADVLQYASGRLEQEMIVEHVLPASPTLLLQLARQASSSDARELAPMKPLLLARAKRLAAEPAAKIPEDERHHLLASIYRLQGDVSAALEEYQAAIDERPFEIEWRHEYGQLLFEAGAFDKAGEQIRWCARRRPNSPVFRDLLQSIQKAQNAAREGEASAEPNAVSPLIRPSATFSPARTRGRRTCACYLCRDRERSSRSRTG